MPGCLNGAPRQCVPLEPQDLDGDGYEACTPPGEPALEWEDCDDRPGIGENKHLDSDRDFLCDVDDNWRAELERFSTCGVLEFGLAIQRWDENPLGDPSWSFALHSMDMLGPLVESYRRSGDLGEEAASADRADLVAGVRRYVARKRAKTLTEIAQMRELVSTAVNVTGDLAVTATMAVTEGEILKPLTKAADAASQSSLGRAVRYMVAHWKGLIRFLDDPLVESETAR